MIYDPFAKPFEEKHPDLKIYNIMDDSLLEETRIYDGMTPAIASRMLNYAKAAEASGASGVLVTCTSVNQATKYIRPLLNIPILNIEEPVAELAVENGTRIGILGTLPTSPAAIGRVIREKAREMGKAVALEPVVVDGAFDVLCSGDVERNDAMVCEALEGLAKRVDVIAFAQISMSLINIPKVDVPVYMIGQTGFDKILAMMEEG